MTKHKPMPWVRNAAIRAKQIDYSCKITMPVRDMYRDGEIVFCVDIYGVAASDLAIVPGGCEPMRKAVERLGLDPSRFQSFLWDIPL